MQEYLGMEHGAFNGDVNIKNAILNNISPERLSRESKNIDNGVFDQIFGMPVKRTGLQDKELCSFHGISWQVKHLADIIAWHLDEKEALEWPETFIRSMRPGTDLQHIEFEMLGWAVRKTNAASTIKKFSKEDKRDVRWANNLMAESDVVSGKAIDKPGGLFANWILLVTISKIAYCGVQNTEDGNDMLLIGALAGARLLRTTPVPEIRQVFLDTIRQAPICGRKVKQDLSLQN